MSLTLAETRTISKEIASALEPLLKWIAVDRAIERGDNADQLTQRFPWLDLVASPVTPPPKPEPQHPDIPDAVLDRIWTLCHCVLIPRQVNTIMSLVSCAENRSCRWPLFYNYIEFGPDAIQSGRGYTTTIFGACSGTGSLQVIFEHLERINPVHPLVTKYGTAIRSVRGGDLTGIEGLAHVGGDPTLAVPDWSKWAMNGRTHLDHIEGDLAQLPLDDKEWQEAVWMAFIDLIWVSAEAFCGKTGRCVDRPGPVLTTALARGILIDTSLNHGDASYWDSAPTWTVIFDEMTSHPTTELAWLAAFLQARKRVLKSGFKQLDWSLSGSRCDIWLDLVARRNETLSRPIMIANSSAEPHPIWPNGLMLG